jgi:hypothetical protein
LILTHLVPGGVVWVAVDDTLCHKRGAKVAFGGIFLDAVLSSRKHKTFRFGLNWVVLGIAVPIPFRTDRYYCLPVLWRLYRKKGQPGYQARPQSAAALARKLAEANPGRTFWLVGDSAYVNAAVLQGRPANLQVIGPLHWKAALYERPAPLLPKLIFYSCASAFGVSPLLMDRESPGSPLHSATSFRYLPLNLRR